MLEGAAGPAWEFVVLGPLGEELSMPRTRQANLGKSPDLAGPRSHLCYVGARVQAI